MIRTLARPLLVSAGLLAAACVDLHAATIQETNNKRCAFSLEGTISSGDFDKFSLIVQRNLARFDELHERTSSICLKSPGGSYGEALKISELLYERGISAVIEYGSECFSACAIIFMAGTSTDRLLPLRKLSAGGILGFHAPFVAMPEQRYSKEQVEEVAQSMRRAILALLRLASKRTRQTGGDFLKKSLIQGILEKGPQEAIFVRRIFDAARWDILIYDAAEHFKIESDKVFGMKNICNNFHYANIDEAVPPNTSLSVQVENYASKFHKDDFRILIRDNAHKSTVCELYAREFKKVKGVSIFACSFDYLSSKSFGNCREYKTSPLFGNYVPDFFALDPDTPLKSFQN
jgi:hypothetical protein